MKNRFSMTNGLAGMALVLGCWQTYLGAQLAVCFGGFILGFFLIIPTALLLGIQSLLRDLHVLGMTAIGFTAAVLPRKPLRWIVAAISVSIFATYCIAYLVSMHV